MRYVVKQCLIGIVALAALYMEVDSSCERMDGLVCVVLLVVGCVNRSFDSLLFFALHTRHLVGTK